MNEAIQQMNNGDLSFTHHVPSVCLLAIFVIKNIRLLGNLKKTKLYN